MALRSIFIDSVKEKDRVVNKYDGYSDIGRTNPDRNIDQQFIKIIAKKDPGKLMTEDER